MGEIRHIQPEQFFESESQYSHRLELFQEKEKVGDAYLVYTSKPFPFYYIAYLEVAREARGKGYGKELVDKVNHFLESKGKAGILEDRIFKNNPAKGMYERYGWHAVPDHAGWYTYNLPEGIDDQKVHAAINRVDEENGWNI
jgi:ribosomal protein S18 acetylase RimI-like enzyme